MTTIRCDKYLGATAGLVPPDMAKDMPSHHLLKSANVGKGTLIETFRMPWWQN
jgi:hypothetical protein